MFGAARKLAKHYDWESIGDDDVFLSNNGHDSAKNDYFLNEKKMQKGHDEVKRKVGTSFVHSLHMPIFERVSREDNVAISVRESGEYTLKALEAGAAAKGHNILDKTIKRSSLSNVYPTSSVVEDMLVGAEGCGFLGRVGRWSHSGLSGIYARNNISDDDLSYDVNISRPIEHELVTEWIRRNVITPYTGDYDLHDLILFKSGVGCVPEAGGEDENRIINKINRLVSEVDPARPYDKTAMNVVRHGPQVNFVPYMWKYEMDKVRKEKGYLGVVANAGPFPIAMVYQGLWYIFDRKQELFDFYNKHNTPIPVHWADGLIDRGGGIVATPEHKRILDGDDE
ncbi:hypothetical protein [Aeromonas jandaei]|uniref:hypothetical protein n=1 Tax=Aeromonas jandaei TaxID=650 RepID=UPI003BA19ED7